MGDDENGAPGGVDCSAPPQSSAISDNQKPLQQGTSYIVLTIIRRRKQNKHCKTN